MTLAEKIDRGEFVVTAELGPPQSSNGDVIRRKAAHFRRGIDGVNITDNQTAIVRLSSISAAVICRQEGLEPIIQMTCRDRNRIAVQSDLLGAAALGIGNVLCLSGDFTSFGNHPEARPVFDMDSIQLIAAVKGMTEGRFLSGDPIKTPPSFLIGGAANPFAEPLDARIHRLEKKIDAGAAFIQTQPVFDLEYFFRWLERVRERDLDRRAAIIAGVMPVKSAAALRYMQDNVPGMRIHPDVIARMEAADHPEETGVREAVETIRALRRTEGIRGVHLMPLNWESVTPVLLDAAGLGGSEQKEE
ncbi:methylenetetrahydrofolate reductase [bacterium]|nr:methylenetetrahydrofolate reductase [bacterium]